MIKVSIISLIYRSPSLADWVYESVHRYTPMIERGEAEFFFVANDPTPAMVAHLESRGYPFVVNQNVQYDEAELFAAGYGKPEHMSRVYRGYNRGIEQATSDYVVLINSDNYFSTDWLENLLKYSDRQKVISSTLVERKHPTFDVFPGAVHGEFGGSVQEFDAEGFASFASSIRKTGLRPGGAYMPTLFHRDVAIQAGLYPTGNIAGRTFDEVVRYGDEAFFDRLAALGVQHFTALDSVVYHLKEGEREDNPESAENTSELPDMPKTPLAPVNAEKTISRIYDPMYPTVRHPQLIAGLLGKPLATPDSARVQAKALAVTILSRLGLLDAARGVLRTFRSASGGR